MPTFLRAWLSLCACRSQGVSSNITLFRSWFFSSGLSSAGVFFHCSKMRWILGLLLAIERARAFAYSRLNTCSEHSYGYSIRYGRARTAYHAGFGTICPGRPWCWRVLELPDLTSLVNSNFFVAGPRIGNGNESVTRIRRDRTGTAPSSPSEMLAAAATAF